MQKGLVGFIGLLMLLILYAGMSVPAVAQTPTEIKVYLPVIFKPYPLPPVGEPGYCLTPDETHLAALINDYRQANGLPAAPLSRSLSMVAQWHVRDLQINKPNTGTDPRGLACNLHSWSNQGNWTPVCYTNDHYYAFGMWSKPDEITNGIYPNYGFEIAVGADDFTVTPTYALDSWKNSPGHNDVILEKNAWAGKNWPAMGVGLYQGYAVVWFGEAVDPYGSIEACP